MRNSRGFTLIEMLVVVLVIVILAAITLAIGAQVQSNSQISLTRAELAGLQAAAQWYAHKGGGVMPPDILTFMEGYQRMHAYQVGGIWRQHKNFLTSLPSSMVVTGMFPAPGGVMPSASNNTGGPWMTGVIELLDAWGNPIQYVPATDAQEVINNTDGFTYPPVAYATNPSDNTYPYPQAIQGPPGTSTYIPPPLVTSWMPNYPIYYGTYSDQSNIMEHGTSNNPPVMQSYLYGQGLGLVYVPVELYNPISLPLPSDVHAPCFFSFGPSYNVNEVNAFSGYSNSAAPSWHNYIYSSGSQ